MLLLYSWVVDEKHISPHCRPHHEHFDSSIDLNSVQHLLAYMTGQSRVKPLLAHRASQPGLQPEHRQKEHTALHKGNFYWQTGRNGLSNPRYEMPGKNQYESPQPLRMRRERRAP